MCVVAWFALTVWHHRHLEVISRCRCPGSYFRRGISGGERKRVSVGHELLINPSIVLLDEPTRCVTSRLFSIMKQQAISLAHPKLSSALGSSFHSYVLLLWCDLAVINDPGRALPILTVVLSSSALALKPSPPVRSGLDSTTALQLVESLRALASGGRAIITTIHQPSSRLYQLLDKLMLLCDGHVMYYGKVCIPDLRQNHAGGGWFRVWGRYIPLVCA